MIEINLARELQVSEVQMKSSSRGLGWIGVVLCLVIGVMAWEWTQMQQEKYANLLQAKEVQSQSLAKTQKNLDLLEQYKEEKQRLGDMVQALYAQRIGKQQPMALLDGVGRSAEGLEVWLDRVQIVDQVVELNGQSLTLKDIGKYLDALEDLHIMAALPVVEIYDKKDKESGSLFSFMIRFTLGPQVTT